MDKAQVRNSFKRNFGLDVLRSISIWLVLLQHAGVGIPGMKPLQIGGVGVEVFFVLSGFLIGGILFKELDKQQSFKQTLKQFWVRRWLRILPLYYLVLFTKFAFDHEEIGWNILYYVFFLQNNFYGIQFMDVSWSLVIEEWFYLFSPIFLFFVDRKGKNLKTTLYAIGGFILFVIIVRSLYVISTNAPYAGINGNFPFRFDSLFIGVLLAFLKHRFLEQFQALTHWKFFLLGLTMFGGYLFYYWSISHELDLVDQTWFARTIGFFLLPLSVGFMVPKFAAMPTLRQTNAMSLLVFRFVKWTSLLTYAIYLLHPYAYLFILKNENFVYHAGIKFIATIAATYLAAYLIYVGFERPILRLRDRIGSADHRPSSPV